MIATSPMTPRSWAVLRVGRQPVMIIGHQKGREVREKVRRNFGMPRPEGYRKRAV